MENLHNARSPVENANRANEDDIMLPSVGMLLTHSVNYDNLDVWNMARFMK